MAKNQTIGQAELTKRILEIIEGESPEVLAEQLSLLEHHMAFKAGVVRGNEKFADIIKK